MNDNTEEKKEPDIKTAARLTYRELPAVGSNSKVYVAELVIRACKNVPNLYLPGHSQADLIQLLRQELKTAIMDCAQVTIDNNRNTPSPRPSEGPNGMEVINFESPDG